MALTVAQLGEAMRLDSPLPAPISTIVTRLLAVGNARVDKLADDAPEEVKDQAIVQFVAYCYDSPHAGSRMNYAAAWRNSGAASIVAPWVARRGVLVEDAGA